MLIRSPRYRRCWAAGLIAAAMMSTLAGGGGALQAALAGPAGDEAARLDQARREIAAIKQRIAGARGRAVSVGREVKALDTQIQELDRQIRSGEQDITVLESEIRSAESRIGELEAAYAKALDTSNERARRLYKSGPVGQISRLLTAKSIGEFIRLTFLWQVAAEIDGETIILASRLRAEVSEQKDDLVKVRSDLAAQKALMEQRRILVASARRDESSALAEINSQIAAEEAHLRALEREARALTAVLRSRLSRSTGEVSRSGFIWPLNGRVTSGYGPRRGRFHSGIDIDGNTGDPIVASKAGTIVGISCGSGYGICTIIDHGGGVATLYAHMSRKAVSSGEVPRGQVIGYVGCTGSCYGSHLHFEVRVNGEPRNPMNFLP